MRERDICMYVYIYICIHMCIDVYKHEAGFRTHTRGRGFHGRHLVLTGFGGKSFHGHMGVQTAQGQGFRSQGRMLILEEACSHIMVLRV